MAAQSQVPDRRDNAASSPSLTSASPAATRAADPHRELLADQAGAIDLSQLARCLAKLGIAAPVDPERLVALLGDLVNAITLYIEQADLSRVSAAPASYLLSKDYVDTSHDQATAGAGSKPYPVRLAAAICAHASPQDAHELGQELESFVQSLTSIRFRPELHQVAYELYAQQREMKGA